MARFIWSLTLYELDRGGFSVAIKGNGHKVVGKGRTPQEAHRAAEIQLVVKPWVGAEPVRQVGKKEPPCS
jgi:hypothetical protein